MNRIQKLFCKHKNTFKAKQVGNIFQALNGERVYIICKDCNKVVDSIFYEHEGKGYK